MWNALVTFIWHWLRPHLGRWIYTSNHFPSGSDGKESAYHAGDPGLFPGSGRSPGEKTGNALQYSCLENSMDRESWQATQSTRWQRVRHYWATFTFTERSEQTNMSKDKREFFFLSFTLILKGEKIMLHPFTSGQFREHPWWQFSADLWEMDFISLSSWICHEPCWQDAFSDTGGSQYHPAPPLPGYRSEVKLLTSYTKEGEVKYCWRSRSKWTLWCSSSKWFAPLRWFVSFSLFNNNGSNWLWRSDYALSTILISLTGPVQLQEARMVIMVCVLQTWVEAV